MQAGTTQLPPDFPYPTQEEYFQGLVLGIGQTLDLAEPVPGSPTSVQEVASLLSSPIKDTIKTVAISLEASTGVGVNDLIGLAQNIHNLSEVSGSEEAVRVVAGLMANTIQLSSSILRTAGVISGSSVAVLGSVVDFVLSVFAPLLAAGDVNKAAQDACDREAAQRADQWCKSLYIKPRQSHVSGPTPADMFAAVLAGSALSPMWLIIALCGEESGIGHITNDMRMPVDSAQKAYHYVIKTSPHGEPGIPPLIQKKMWTLVKSICRSIIPAGLTITSDHQTDGGVVPFGILLGIINSCIQAGYITIPDNAGEGSTLTRLGRVLGRYVVTKPLWCPPQGDAAAGKYSKRFNCEYTYDLVSPLTKLLVQSKLQMEACARGEGCPIPSPPNKTIIKANVALIEDLKKIRFPGAIKRGYLAKKPADTVQKYKFRRVPPLKKKKKKVPTVVAASVGAGAGWLVWKYLLKGLLMARPR